MQNIVYHSKNIVTILYIFKVCIQSTCTQSVICHVVCYAQPQKATISCSFYLPPCFIPPATTAASTWLIYNCILTVELLKILTFYAISVCFWLQKPLKKQKLCRTCAPALCFPSYPLQLLALAIQLRSICIYMSKD